MGSGSSTRQSIAHVNLEHPSRSRCNSLERHTMFRRRTNGAHFLADTPTRNRSHSVPPHSSIPIGHELETGRAQGSPEGRRGDRPPVLNQLLCHQCRRIYQLHTSAEPSCCPRCGGAFFEFQNLEALSSALDAQLTPRTLVSQQQLPARHGGDSGGGSGSGAGRHLGSDVGEREGGGRGMNTEELLFNMIYFADQEAIRANLGGMFRSTLEASQIAESVTAPTKDLKCPAPPEVVRYLKTSISRDVGRPPTEKEKRTMFFPPLDRGDRTPMRTPCRTPPLNQPQQRAESKDADDDDPLLLSSSKMTSPYDCDQRGGGGGESAKLVDGNDNQNTFEAGENVWLNPPSEELEGGEEEAELCDPTDGPRREEASGNTGTTDDDDDDVGDVIQERAGGEAKKERAVPEMMATSSNDYEDMDLDECVVCTDEILFGQEVIQLPNCVHHFHADCILRWLDIQPTCPSCRVVITMPPVDENQSEAKEVREERGDDNDDRSSRRSSTTSHSEKETDAKLVPESPLAEAKEMEGGADAKRTSTTVSENGFVSEQKPTTGVNDEHPRTFSDHPTPVAEEKAEGKGDSVTDYDISSSASPIHHGAHHGAGGNGAEAKHEHLAAAEDAIHSLALSTVRSVLSSARDSYRSHEGFQASTVTPPSHD